MHISLRSRGVWSLAALAAFALSSVARATLVVNPPLPITDRVSVRIIPVADFNGDNAAPLFGTADQQAAVFSFVDQIWAQAGIDVDFTIRPGTYNDTFALTGTPGANNPRVDFDLQTIVNTASSIGGVLDPNFRTLDVFMVRIVPGFSQMNNIAANGQAFINANGIAYWAGPSLPGSTDGQQTLAAVLAHEIGHNLGLEHVGTSLNLMQPSVFGERLTPEQIQTALDSQFSESIPEPAGLCVVGMSLLAVVRRRRHAA